MAHRLCSGSRTIFCLFEYEIYINCDKIISLKVTKLFFENHRKVMFSRNRIKFLGSLYLLHTVCLFFLLRFFIVSDFLLLIFFFN